MRRESATDRDWVGTARELAPAMAARAGGYDERGTFPVEDLAALRAEGMLGLLVPTRLGGGGASFATYAEVALELGRGNGASALAFNMHASVTGALATTPDPLVRALGGSQAALEARDRILEAAAHGAVYGVAMSERGAGARLSRLATSYTACEGGYRIQGEKAFVTGAGHVDAYLVAARDAAGAEAGRVSYFLVPAGPGVEVVETWDVLGMRATASHDLHLDVVVAPEGLLGGIEGAAVLLAQLMPQWLVASYAAVYVGVATAALEAAVAHVRRRGLEGLPAVRSRLGRADAAVAAARLVVLEAARRVDEAPGDPTTNRWVWRAKLVAGDTAAEVASSLIEAAGASATRRGEPLERLYRDARCGALQPATSDVCADWLGLAALGRDPSGEAAVPRW